MPEAQAITDFDADSFFAAYEKQLAAIDIAANAQAALGNILTVQTEDGEARSYEQIRQEAESFFANPAIAADMQLLDRLAAQYAQFCLGHGHEAMGQLAGGSLEELFERGLAHAGHAHEHSQRGEDEKTKQKKKTNKARRLGLWALAARYGQNE